MITDLTAEHPKKTLWRFALPMFISVMFQQFYNIADSSIAGRFAGEDALAAVGASYPITVIFMAFAVGSNLGASVVVSRLFGAKDIGRMKTAVYTAFIACGAMSLVLMVIVRHEPDSDRAGICLLRGYDAFNPYPGQHIRGRGAVP